MATPQLHVVLGIGPLGRATAYALLRRGHHVRMVSRSGQVKLPTTLEHVAADLYNVAQVQQVTAGATAVYQCAQPGYTEWVVKFPPLQTAIIDGVAATGAKLIVAENLYMYGMVDGPIHADLPMHAHTRKGRVRAQMAREVAEAHQRGLVRTASARGSDFYGPGVLGSALGERVFRPALAGKAAEVLGRLDQPHSYTYIGDFGETLAMLGERDDALGRHWHVPNAPACTQAAVMRLIFDALGKPVKVNLLGRPLMLIAGLFIPMAREGVEMLYEFERPFVVDSSPTEQTFGLVPLPLAEGIQHTLDWYRQETD